MRVFPVCIAIHQGCPGQGRITIHQTAPPCAALPNTARHRAPTIFVAPKFLKLSKRGLLLAAYFHYFIIQLFHNIHSHCSHHGGALSLITFLRTGLVHFSCPVIFNAPTQCSYSQPQNYHICCACNILLRWAYTALSAQEAEEKAWPETTGSRRKSRHKSWRERVLRNNPLCYFLSSSTLSSSSSRSSCWLVSS